MPARERSSTGVEADFDLRKLLDRPGSYAAIAASAAYGRRSHFPVTLFDHIGDVYRRVETAAGAELPDVIARLRLTALVHEEPPRSLPALLASTGLSGFTPIVVAVTGAFGRVWKVRTDAEVRAYVGENEAHLAPILLFELADEGRPAAAMGRAAEAGGLRAAFARWAARLAVDRR